MTEVRDTAHRHVRYHRKVTVRCHNVIRSAPHPGHTAHLAAGRLMAVVAGLVEVGLAAVGSAVEDGECKLES